MPKTTQPTQKKLRIPKEGKKIAGVAAAFANYFGWDVTLVRIFWVLLLLPGGLPGIIPYLVCWMVIPEERQPHYSADCFSIIVLNISIGLLKVTFFAWMYLLIETDILILAINVEVW